MASRPLPAWAPPVLRAPLRALEPGDDEPTLASMGPIFGLPALSALPALEAIGPPPPPRPPPTLPPIPDDLDAYSVFMRRPDPEEDSDELGADDRTGTFQRPIRGVVSRVSPARMVIEVGPQLGAVLEVPAQGGRVGRAAECELRLGSSQVSRLHAALERVGLDVFVQNLSSASGLFLNQVAVHRARLMDGDLLQVGDVVLRFERG